GGPCAEGCPRYGPTWPRPSRGVGAPPGPDRTPFRIRSIAMGMPSAPGPLRARLAWSLVALGTVVVVAPGRAQAPPVLRVVQTNSAGNDAHVIDPATNRVVAVIDGLGKPHGVMVSPEGTRYYFTNEEVGSLDVVDTRTLERVNRIPLAGTPHNPALSTTARKAY